MLQKKPLTLAVRAALGLTTVVMAMPMLAQAQAATDALEEVVVTGSRIQKANLVTSSPVTQLDAEQLTMTGITRLEDVLKDLPQIYQAQGSTQSNGATGTATLNLRNLGDNRTLVLVDGKRLPQGSPIQGGDGADINQIPGALVKRVEVMTGGASSTYGSDAVAGVVNFIMVDDFEGVKFDYQASRYRHDNDGNEIATATAARGFPVPSGSVTDGDISDMSLIMGGNLNEGRGNVTAYATYRDIEALLQSERDYSACTPNGGNTGCGGSGTHDKGRFTDFDTYDFRVEGDQFVPNAGYAYNFGPLNYWQRPDERYTAGAFANYEINKHVEAYTQLMFMDDRTVSQIAPSGAFFVTSTIPCGNPFLSAQQFSAIGCASTDDVVAGYIGRRNVEGGGRQQDLRHTTLRGVFGLRGEIDEQWRYDLSGQYSEVSMENTYLNDFSTTRIIKALDVVADARGRPVCRSALNGSDPNCVPWNVFQTGGVTQEALNYLQLPLFARGTTDQTVIGGYVQGSLGEYGLKLPTATDGVDVVFGFEWREENLDFNPDKGFQDGDGAGQGGPTLPVSGGYEVGEVYAEASIPLIQGAAFAEEVTLDLGYRYSDYDTDNTTDTWKIASGWAINQQVKVRASFQRAVRAANLREMFQPVGLNLFDMAQDPCSGVGENGLSAAGYTFDQCARSGITAVQWAAGGPPDSPAGQYNYNQGGNRNLKPEESDTQSIGLVLTPDFVDGLSLTLDYYDIEVKDAIDNRGAEYILTQCVETGDPELCGNVSRGPNGNLWVGDAAVGDYNFNTGFFQVKGWDIAADYSFDINDFGTLSVNNTMSIIDSWEQQQTPGGTVDECEGTWGGTCGYPTPDFRNVLRTTWSTPWDVMVSLSWRHIGEVEDNVETAAAIDLDATDYFDLSGIWSINDNAAVRAGINNLLDEEPPIAGFNAGAGINGNGNTFPGMYDALGQYLFVGATLTF